MEIIIRRRDIYVVAVVLSVFFSWVAYATYENFDARTNLRDLAEVHIDEWFNTEPEGTKREDYEYLAIVDTERPYEVFGPTFGVIHVYIRDRGDEACETFKGIEYYYRMGADGWDLEHSAGCAAREHHVRAFQHYLDRGAGVEERVIDQALGIQFDVTRAEEYLKARREGRNPFLAAHSHGADHDDHPHASEEHLDDTHADDRHAHDRARETAKSGPTEADDERPGLARRRLAQELSEGGHHGDEISKEGATP